MASPDRRDTHNYQAVQTTNWTSLIPTKKGDTAKTAWNSPLYPAKGFILFLNISLTSIEGSGGSEKLALSSFKSYITRISAPYPWNFVGYVVLAMLIPKFYELSNTFWIGHISFQALAITEQYEFLAVIIEIVNETIPFGILALVAQNYKNHEKIISILKAGLIFQVAFSLILTSTVILFTPQFVSTIGTPTEIVSLTSTYLVLKSIALPFDAVATLLLIAIKSMRKGREALYLVLISVVLNMILDLFLISNTSISLQMGIEGVAIGYVISKIALATISSLFTIKILSLNWNSMIRPKWRDMVRPLFAVGGWTGLDSLVRNVGYILVPLGVLNVIGANQFGGYGLAMTVMWTLIIPILAITEGTNVVVGNYYGQRKYADLKKIVFTSLFLVSIAMLVIAIGGVFLWDDLSFFFNQNPVMVQYSIATFWWLMIPYCCFSLSMVLRSVFFGTGKTSYVFYVSCILNFGLIFPFWGLSRLGLVTASFDNVMFLFVFVFIIDLIVTSVMVKRLLSHMKVAPETESRQVPN